MDSASRLVSSGSFASPLAQLSLDGGSVVSHLSKRRISIVSVYAIRMAYRGTVMSTGYLTSMRKLVCWTVSKNAGRGDRSSSSTTQLEPFPNPLSLLERIDPIF